MRRGEHLGNRAWIVGDVAYVDISTTTFPRAVAIIDTADVDLMLDSCGRWRAGRCGRPNGCYVWRNVGPRAAREYVFLHRFLMGLRKGERALVDHRNLDGLDNRRGNLRVATGTQNSANRLGLGRKTPYKGVWPLGDGRFRANIGVDGRTRYLGLFGTAESAARAYDNAAAELFGEFARLNFPLEDVAA